MIIFVYLISYTEHESIIYIRFGNITLLRLIKDNKIK
jgi:hypothetical protein